MPNTSFFATMKNVVAERVDASVFDVRVLVKVKNRVEAEGVSLGFDIDSRIEALSNP
ncbi:hypothetical protein D3C81_1896790 [compost metagenome]